MSRLVAEMRAHSEICDCLDCPRVHQAAADRIEALEGAIAGILAPALSQEEVDQALRYCWEVYNDEEEEMQD